MSSLPDTHRPQAVNPDPRLRAVAADLEYFRAKRLEPRILHLVRRGVISFNDLIRAGRDTAGGRTSHAAPADVEQRLRALEDRLDAFVAGVAAVAVATRSADVVIEDIRHERGDSPPLRTVCFGLQELTGRPSRDYVTADLHEDWLEPAHPPS